MGQWKKTMTEQLRILDEIAAKNDTLHRFIKQRKIVGIGRVLRERHDLIVQLIALHDALSNEHREVAVRYQEIVESSRQLLREASEERSCIAAELRNSRTQRQVRNQYLNPWLTVIARGRHVNAKG